MDQKLQLVILVHGIRTRAEWQDMVVSELERPGQTKVVPLKYGFLDAFRFWRPDRRAREAAIQELRWRLKDAVNQTEHHELVIIAHSFGTFAILEILRDEPSLCPDRVIFCGSVVPATFRWDILKNRPPLVVNDCGTRDIWPVLAQSFSWHYGATGTFGFGVSGIHDRYHKGGHGLYFTHEFVKTFWCPFVHSSEHEQSTYSVTRPPAGWWISILPMVPFKWIVVLLMMAAVYGTYHLTKRFVAEISFSGGSGVSSTLATSNRPPSGYESSRNWLEPLNVRNPEEAGKLRAELWRNAESGDHAAMVRLGFMLLTGDAWTPVDRHSGLAWLRKAADAGFAQGILIRNYLDETVDVDWSADHVQLARSLLARPDLDSLTLTMLGEDAAAPGEGLTRNDAQAFELARRAADRGEPRAMLNLSNCYESAQGVERNVTEAVRLVRRAIDLGSAEGIEALGNAFLSGTGVLLSRQEAVRCYREAVDRGLPSAMTRLGTCYLNGSGVALSVDRGLNWIRKGADLGDGQGMLELGHCYFKSIGLPQDYGESLKWYQRAAARGYSDAFVSIGRCYMNGYGVEKSPAEAIHYYRKAAERDNPDAMYDLASAYVNGLGVEKNMSEAIKWFEAGALLGNTSSKAQLGYLRVRGIATNADLDSGLSLLRDAADADDCVGMYYLGTCYELGLGVRIDTNSARNWYAKSAKHGNLAAIQALERVMSGKRISLPPPVNALENTHPLAPASATLAPVPSHSSPAAAAPKEIKKDVK